MARIPTFEARGAGGSGGIVQAGQVSMAKARPFRKTTGMKGSDIYQQSGDQAMIGALGGMVDMFKTVQIQKQKAKYDETKNAIRADMIRTEADFNYQGKEADVYAQNNIKSYQSQIDTLDPQSREKLRNEMQIDFAKYGTQAMMTSTAFAREESMNTANQELINDGRDLQRGEKSIIDIDNSIRHKATEFVDNDILGSDGAKEWTRKALKAVRSNHIKATLNEAETMSEIDSARGLIDSYGFYFNEDEVRKLTGSARSARERIISDNKIEKYATLNSYQQQADKGDMFTPMQIDDIVDTFGIETYDRLVANRNVAFKNLQEQKEYQVQFAQANASALAIVGGAKNLDEDEKAALFKQAKADLKLKSDLKSEEINNIFASAIGVDQFVALNTTRAMVHSTIADSLSKRETFNTLLNRLDSLQVRPDMDAKRDELSREFMDEIIKDPVNKMLPIMDRELYDNYINDFTSFMNGDDSVLMELKNNAATLSSIMDSNPTTMGSYLTNGQVEIFKQSFDRAGTDHNEFMANMSRLNAIYGDKTSYAIEQIVSSYPDSEQEQARALFDLAKNTSITQDTNAMPLAYAGIEAYSTFTKDVDNKNDMISHIDKAVNPAHVDVVGFGGKMDLTKKIYSALAMKAGGKGSEDIARQAYDLAWKNTNVLTYGDDNSTVIPSIMENPDGSMANVDMQKASSQMSYILSSLDTNMHQFLPLETLAAAMGVSVPTDARGKKTLYSSINPNNIDLRIVGDEVIPMYRPEDKSNFIVMQNAKDDWKPLRFSLHKIMNTDIPTGKMTKRKGRQAVTSSQKIDWINSLAK